MKIFFLIVVFVFSFKSLAKEGGRKYQTFYFQGQYGNTIAGDDEEDRHSELSLKNVTHDQSSGYLLALGYRWKWFGLEAVYGDFGSPALIYEDTLKVEKNVHFAGGGFHWFLWIFDLKLGWATFRGNRKFTISESAPANTVVDPMNSRINSGGGYFGLGLNFNLGDSTELIFDYTGYVFKEKGVTYTINGKTEAYPRNPSGEAGAEDAEITGFVGIVGIGIRWFF